MALKRGRKVPPITEDQVWELARIQCTYKEMSAVLGVSEDYLRDHFKDMINEAQEQGKASLRRTLIRLADKGNLGAAVWLSKQYLGMREVQATDITSGGESLAKGFTSMVTAVEAMQAKNVEKNAARKEARAAEKEKDK